MTGEAMLWWALALLFASLLVVALEMFVPSGGLLAVLAGGLAIGSVVCFWRVSPTWGVSSLIALLVLTPVVIGFFFKIYPDTPMGRRMILGSEREVPEGEHGAAPPPANALDSLIGHDGDVITSLRPVGMIRIDGVRHEALSEHGVIEAGARVRVIAVEGDRIRVRQVV